jgi:flagellar biosynthesis anti-sigma factor FlgM
LKIDPSRIAKVLNLYANQDIQTRNVKKKSDKADEVVLSDNAHVFQAALKAARSAADVRQAKVEEVKARMESGQYSINSWDVASKMVDNVFKEDKL